MKLFSIQRKGNSKVIQILGIKIKFKGYKNNHIYLVSEGKKREVKKIKGLKITFCGTNATIEIGSSPCPTFINSEILCGTNSVVSIGSSQFKLRYLNIQNRTSGGVVTIGKNCSSQSVKIINENEHNLKIEIGDDCMFSTNVYIRPSDGHTIYDTSTMEILNNPADIKLGKHIWVGKDVTILKGANIPNNFVVGANSIVTQSSIANKDQYTTMGGVLIGSPARVVKTGINWDRLASHDFKLKYY